ncbi:MAG: hypothetical protein ORN29_05610 [Rhodoferax sp.]|nr:hypothetical protein [Rhodoferax sp.]
MWPRLVALGAATMEFVGTTRNSKQYIMDAYQFNGLSKLLCLPPATLRRCIAIAFTTTAVLPLLACTQNLNWRVVQLANLRTMLPCKPDQASRPIALGDQTVTMDMMGCEVDKALFTVSHIQATQAADVAQAAGLLSQLRAASLASVAAHRISPAANSGDAQHSLDVQVDGTRPTGTPVQARFKWLLQGQHIYQLAVYADHLTDEQTETLLREAKLQ